VSRFTIVVDSNCDLPPDYVEKYGIEIMPMPFDLDGTPHNQGYWQDISGKEFYDALRKGSVAKTSQITPYVFNNIFTEYAKQGQDVLFLFLSSGLSTTFSNAQMALQDVRESYPGCGVHIIDTINATVGHGLIAILAAKKRTEGFSVAETAVWLEKKKHSCIGVFTVDDLMYLHRGGRLSRLSAIAGSVLGIKPVLNLAPDGTLALKDKARRKKGAMEMMVSQLKRSINPDTELDTVFIAHTDCPEDAQTFADMVRASVNVREVTHMLMGPIIGAHLGPGSLVLLFEADMTRKEYESKFYK
jgi:DegV family protein with EDD domain